MSGFQGTLNTNGLRPQKIRFGSRPPVGGAMSATVNLSWKAPAMAAVQSIDASSLAPALDAIAAVEIDNRRNGYGVLLTFPDTQQNIVCPPFGRACLPAATAQMTFQASLIIDPSIVAASLTSGLAAATIVRLYNVYLPETYEHPEYIVANDILVPKRVAVTSIAGVLETTSTASALLYSSQLPNNPGVPVYTILKALRGSLQIVNPAASVAVTATLTDNETLGYTFGTWTVQSPSTVGYYDYPDLIMMEGSELVVRGQFKLTLTTTSGTALLNWNFSGLSTNFPNFLWGPNG